MSTIKLFDKEYDITDVERAISTLKPVVKQTRFKEMMIDNDMFWLDTVTGLYWEYKQNTEQMPWKEATEYALLLRRNSRLLWRLPTRLELLNITDDSKYLPATELPKVLSGGNYWSSSTYVNSITNAWLVYFYDGYSHYSNKAERYYVRCVSTGEKL